MSILYDLRVEKKFTRYELSVNSGVSLIRIILYEKNILKIENAPLRITYPLSVVLNVDITQLVNKI